MNGRRLAAGALLLALWIVGGRLLSAPQRLVVEVAMASERRGTAQLFVDDGAGFRESLSARARVPGDGPAIVRFSLPAPAAVRALRLDPLNSAGRLSIAAIAVDLGPERRVFRGAALASWRAAHDLTTADEDPADGILFESLGRDPRLVRVEAIERPGIWTRAPDRQEVSLALGAAVLLILGLAPPASLGRLAGSLALAAPLLFFFAFNLAALEDGWIRDDPCLLRSTLEHGAVAHFVDPAAWRSLSGSVLMSWTPLSFAADHALFGLEPRAFYAHQLSACVVLLGLGFALLRRAGPFAASLALSLFVLSPPAFAVARQLMNRHYLEGTLLILVALGLFRHAVERESRAAAFLGALAYLLATSAKEVFVPLVAVLPFVPCGDPRSRWRAAVPYFVAAALYLPWRLTMLGTGNALSGYAGRERSPLADALAALPAQLGLHGIEVWLAGLAVGAALVYLAQRERRWLPFTAVLTAALTLPLLPILGELGPRHFFLPALALASLCGPACASLGRLRAPAGLLLAFGTLAALADSPIRLHHDSAAALYETEGRFLLEDDRRGLLASQLADTQFLRCTAQLRRLAGRAAGPGYCGDPCFCATTFPGEKTWRAAAAEIVALDLVPEASCAVSRELEIDVRWDESAGRLAWEFGPFTDGRWSLLLIDEATPGVSPPVPLAAAGEAPLTVATPWRFVVRYEAPDGSKSYSRVLEITREARSAGVVGDPGTALSSYSGQ